MERNLALEALHVTEAAAMACGRIMGLGDEYSAYQKAREAMHRAFDSVQLDGTIVMGEGKKGECHELFVGENIGTGKPPTMDIALDPLEGTTICATGGPNSISVIAIGEKGSFKVCSETYMEKIAVGPRARGAIHLDLSPAENLKRVAAALDCYLEDLAVVILDRPRHAFLIREVREAGARIRLIGDGDVSAAIATSIEGSGVDILMGIGGAKEGVLAAAALKCMGGDIQGRLVSFPSPGGEEKRRENLPIWGIDSLVKGDDMMFVATGVTEGDALRGVRFYKGGAVTYSLVTQLQSRTVRFVETRHNFQV